MRGNIKDNNVEPKGTWFKDSLLYSLERLFNTRLLNIRLFNRHLLINVFNRRLLYLGHYNPGSNLSDGGLPIPLGQLGLDEQDLVTTQTRELNKNLKVKKLNLSYFLRSRAVDGERLTAGFQDPILG